MSRREQNVLRMIWRDFISSIFVRAEKPKLMGEDFYGTKYFETPPRRGSSKRPARHFEPVNKDDHEQEIPAEWEAWLRYRRRVVPTNQEVEENYKLILTKRENAAKLVEKYSGKEIEKINPPMPASNPGNFPVYEEYQDVEVKYQPHVKK
ncbi:NADH dehydrogenase [ubiquinone] 1 alpha subcomplex assembly factor 2 [Leptopilina boulardi]|uniref:NADH dehydrogenase [ubiquinone] 1 alpha subcomplex assembly factor 2 n=1 Tax=Leptopilina boulardi TaxID=63433 RepID=UPI0021F58ED9|nr:NADH dehydrogenase [ubiquinone] 1 alpha subcomplex assembly factor 2 [Leptopilina boulardi]